MCVCVSAACLCVSRCMCLSTVPGLCIDKEQHGLCYVGHHSVILPVRPIDHDLTHKRQPSLSERGMGGQIGLADQQNKTSIFFKTLG